MSKTAIELLKDDHRKVMDLLDQLVQSTTRAEKKRRQLLEKIDQEMYLHTQLEEEIFYPAFRESGNSEHKKMYYEALEEHRAVEELVLPDLMKTEPTSEKFSGRAKVLKELIEHHIEEEEKDMFRKARSSLSREELSELSERMTARRQELQKEMSGTRAA